MTKFEDLLAGEVRSLSLINEPPQPVEVEMLRLTAREIARKRWKKEPNDDLN
jgi:hypothetical protein